MSVRFKDIGKALNSLLFKDGWDLKNQAKVEAKSDSKKFTAEWEQSGSGDNAVVKGTVGAEVTLATAFDTTTVVGGTVDTNGTIKDTLSVKGLAKGVEVLGTYRRHDPKEANNFTLGARYRYEGLDAEFNVDLLPQEKSTHDLEAAATFAHSGFVLGARSVVALVGEKTEEKEAKKADRVKEYDFAAAYVAKDVEVSVKTEKKLKVVNAGFIHHLNPTVDIGASVKIELPKKKTDEKAEEEKAAYTFTVGTSVVSADGTVSKVRIDNKGDLLGSFTAPVRGNASITIVGKVSTKNASAHQVGLQVALK